MTEMVQSAGGALAKPPVIDSVDQRRLQLIRAKVSRGYGSMVPTDSELASFLELAANYDLDPFADEVWLVKSAGKNGGEGQLLIMVGRNGLRKIAKRQGLELDSDSVREKDIFIVERRVVEVDGRLVRTRTIRHDYAGTITQRGPIVGAWAEVYDQRGITKGYNYAPMSEYRPKNENKLQYSPWGSAESIMIQTAAERNALRQATPLGGIVAEGEEFAGVGLGDPGQGHAAAGSEQEAIASFIHGLDLPVDLRDELLGAIYLINARSPYAYGLAKIQMAFPGRSEEDLRRELRFMQDSYPEAFRDPAEPPAEPEEAITDAEVVDERSEQPEPDELGGQPPSEPEGGDQDPEPSDDGPEEMSPEDKALAERLFEETGEKG